MFPTKSKPPIHLSKGQQKLWDLYIQARGRVVVWTKNGKTRLIDPKEIEIFQE